MSDVPSSVGPGRATRDVDLPTEAAGTGYARTDDPSLRTEAYREPAGASESSGGQARQVAQQGRQAAAQATSEVSDTAREQAHRVAGEARAQARNLASDVRDRVGERARSQSDRLVTGIRQAADQLDEMRGNRGDSPAATVVNRVAQGGRQFADYLDRNGPEGVLREVQDFARRRPGAFLAAALAAGFVVGRLGKSVAQAQSPDYGKPDSDTFTSSPTGNRTGYGTNPAATGSYTADPTVGTGYEATGYPAAGAAGYGASPAGTTEYAATGTGTPIPVDEFGTGNSSPVDDYPGGSR